MTHPDAHCHGETFYFVYLYFYFTVRIISLYFISINNLVLFFHLHSLDHFRESYLINAMTEGRAKNLDFMRFDEVSYLLFDSSPPPPTPLNNIYR